jgi:putative ABC transport system permease protein
MGAFWSDLRYGARLLRKSPVFTLAAILTLALGVGVNTAVFSIVNALLLRPLPSPGSDRLVVIASSHRDAAGLDGVSSPDLDAYGELTGRAFEGIAGYSVGFSSFASGDAEAAWVLTTEVTGNYFETLGLTPSVGRLPGAADVRAGVASPLAMLGYGAWQRRFAGDPNIVGRQIRIDGRPVTVIGVAPEAFFGTFAFSETEVYLPLTWREGLAELRAQHAIGKLRRSVSVESAQVVMDAVALRLASDRREAYEGVSLRVIPEPLARPLEDQARWNGRAGAVTLILVVLVLGVATVNVVNLVLARNVERQREMAVRASIGAGRGRLLRQLLTESLAIAGLGGAAGLALGGLTARALSWIRLPDDKPARLVFEIDWRVLAYAAVLSLAAAAIVGVAPAFQTSQQSLFNGLRDGVRGAGGDRVGRRIRRILVSTQLAACFVLLAAAGLFSRSLALGQQVDLGFEPRGVLNVGISAAPLALDEADERALFDRLLRRVREVAGVEHAAFAQIVPLGYVQLATELDVEGLQIPRAERPSAGFNLVTPEYFATMAIPIVRGRGFSPGDTAAAPRVAVVNRELAERVWPGADPIGRRFRLEEGGESWVEVVGMTPTGKYQSFSEDPRPFVYLSLDQARAGARYLQVRTTSSPESLTPSIRDALRSMSRDLVIYDVMSMERALRGGMGFFLPRTVAGLAAMLGLLALALAVVGVYGVVAHAAGQRRHEMGVRVALGASPGAIARLVVADGTRMIVVGVVAGLALTLAAAPFIGRFLFGVSGRDPLTLGVAVPLLAAVALAASAVPAWRATRDDPIAALRQE